jgi:hypothetical protein
LAVVATGAAVGPTAKHPYFAFPIVGGMVDKDPLGGRIVHSGGLSFSAGSKSVVVKRFEIELKRAVLTAKVAGTGLLRGRRGRQDWPATSRAGLEESRPCTLSGNLSDILT